ncbi:MAG: amidohydrolase family protein, partial [Micrococcales bacterium]|nr:amidohydrolase family protein [Micrococcales bacterium]
LLSDENVRSYDPIFKVNPPLRSDQDVAALRAALADGTIDIVATDHAPHPREAKDCEWAAAAFGMIGLETALPIVHQLMVETGLMTWDDVARVMSEAPAWIGRVANQGRPIKVGAPAHLTLFNPTTRWKVDAKAQVSASSNTPVDGRQMHGRTVATFLRGRATVLDGKLVR